MTNKVKKALRELALALLQDPMFLFRLNQKLGEMGVIGEEKNRMTLFLAAVTKDFSDPVSILVKGPTSSGKNSVVRRVVEIMPPECVIRRASLTKKALAYGDEELSGKVFYLYEYAGGRDAQYMTRELQSEKSIEHEHTVLTGGTRKTKVARRAGDPVFFSTTTDLEVYADDETRFLSLRSDESEELTRAILQSKFKQGTGTNSQPVIEVWHEAMRILANDPPAFAYPDWFAFIADHIPAKQTRARRDCNRFISLLKAVALCRSFSDNRRKKKQIVIRLSDYAVAYDILSEAFSFTYGGAHPQAMKVAQAVRELYEIQKGTVTISDVAKHLDWDKQLAYKWSDVAVNDKMIIREVSSNKNNVKRLSPGINAEKKFLPEPIVVLRDGQSRFNKVKYIDLFSGKETILLRESTGTNGKTKHVSADGDDDE